MYMGEVCFEMKKYSQAEGYFVKANQVDPNMEEAKDARAKAKFALAMENGNVSFLGKKYSVAIVYYTEATILNTKDSKAFFKLGESFYNNLQFAKAEENLKRSISLEKKNKSLLFVILFICKDRQIRSLYCYSKECDGRVSE